MPIDLLRIFGILAIVAGHVWDNEFIRKGIYTWHVPLFFFLTGYLWTVHRPIRDEVRKRSKTLLMPYLAWVLILGIPYIAALAIRQTDFPAETVFQILWGGNAIGRPFSAFWFVTALYFATIFLRLMQNLYPWVSWAVATVGLFVAHLYDGALSTLPLAMGVVFPSLIFILAGVALRAIRNSIPAPPFVASTLLLISAVLILGEVAAPLDIKQADFGTPFLSVFVATAICVGLILIVEEMFHSTKVLTEWTTELAAAGLMVVLTHAAVLWILRTPSTGSWVDMLVATAAPWMTALVLRRTRLSQYLLGTPRIQNWHKPDSKREPRQHD
ncbi:acyltransferase family protein [Mycolicibacterium iranicum]|nr:acyltransferase family protein [Mycolicibacterium iranicum]